MFFSVSIIVASVLFKTLTFASTNYTDVTNVLERNPFMSHNGVSPILMQSFYKKFQSGILHLAAPSLIYMKVPGLTFAFHHKTSLVYRLSFEAECRVSEYGSVFQLEFMYDDSLLRNGNQLVPNNGFDPSYNVPTHWHPPRGNAYHEICFRSDLVYMPSGTHVIDVGFRLLNVPFQNAAVWVQKAKLTIELIQYHPTIDHGLPILHV